MGNGQNWLSSWVRWWNIPNQSQPNRGFPVDAFTGDRPFLSFRLWLRREQAVRAARRGGLRGAELGGRGGQPALQALHPEDPLRSGTALQEALRHDARFVDIYLVQACNELTVLCGLR